VKHIYYRLFTHFLNSTETAWDMCSCIQNETEEPNFITITTTPSDVTYYEMTMIKYYRQLCWLFGIAEVWVRNFKKIFSERSLYVVVRPSVVCLSVCRLSVTFVRPTQAIVIFGNVTTQFGTLAICRIIAFLRLIHYFTPWPWPLTFDLKHLQRIVCDVIKLCTKFEYNRAILGGVIAISVFDHVMTLNMF